MKLTLLVFLLCVTTLVISSCGGKSQHLGRFTQDPMMSDKAFHMQDCVNLPYAAWGNQANPEVVIIALHGFNDYRNTYKDFAHKAERKNSLIYAYDQRGFGATPKRGIWADSNVTVQDLLTVTSLVKDKHPGKPIYWMGESMGGAILMVASKYAKEAGVAGMVLSAPAVWGWRHINPMHAAALWLGDYFIPWLKVSGEGLDIAASDNNEMLCALGDDPLIIKKTRIDALHGLVELMTEAGKSACHVTVPTLILYGANDQLVPKRPVQIVLGQLPKAPYGHWKTIYYRNGYHMLFRDLDGGRVIDDIFAWIHDQPLPSLKTQPEHVTVFDAHHKGEIPLLASAN